MVFFNNKYRNALIPDTKTEPRAKGASTYKKTQKKWICVKTMAVKKLGRKMSGPQGSCHPLSVLLINSKKKSEFTFTILRQRQYFRRNTQRKRESYNAKQMLALPSNSDSYELSTRFFFFLKLLKFLIVNETRMFLRMSLSRTCQLNVCVYIFLLFQWPSLPLSLSFYGYRIN